jgi:hypothetical protein
VVRELRPRIVVLENVAALLTRGLDRVLGTLAEIGFDAEWHCIPAAAVGAPTWHTPCARDFKGYTMREGESICNQLRRIFHLTSGTPHPAFAEEVQGFPEGWTDLEDSETQ